MLQIELGDGFVPQIGDAFPIASAASVDGLFDALDLPAVTPGTMWTIDYGTTSVTLSLVLAGDLDGDGFVGISDLNAVLQGWNESVDPWDRASGDVTGDGFVGIADLNLVLGNWNASAPPAADTSNNVPAPTALWVTTLMGAGMLCRRAVATLNAPSQLN
jgi:hypothetical protein